MSLGIALIGTGSMARKHAGFLSSHEEARLEMVCSTQRSAVLADDFCREYGFRRATQDFQSVLEDERVEAVYICSPDATHPEFASRALRAGKHVFCEKPLGRNEKGFRLVEEAHRDSRRILQVGMNCRYREQYSGPKHLADSGELGPLRFIRGIYLLNKVRSAKLKEKRWWLEHPQDILFFLHANGIHILDLVRWFGGPVRSVFSRATGFELGDDFRADTFSISLSFDSGAIGEVLISSVAFQPRDVSLQIWFERGSLLGTTVYTREGEDLAPASRELPVIQKTIDLGLQFQDFLQAIATGKDPMNDIRQARENLVLIQAVERSLQTGRDTPVRAEELLVGGAGRID